MRKRTYFRAAVLLAPLLAGCYAGLGHMLEEDYNPRFTVMPPTVQAPAPQPQQPQTPAQPQQQPRLIRHLNASLTDGDTNIQPQVEGTDFKWEVKKKDGSPFTKFDVLGGGTFHIYYPRSGLTLADCPLELVCTGTVDGVQLTSYGYLYYFDDSDEFWDFVEKYYY